MRIGLDVKTQSRIEALRKRFLDDDESKKEFSSMDKLLELQKNFESIKDSIAVQQIRKDAENVINGINILLETKEDMTEMERKMLFRERKIHNFYLNRFDKNRINTRVTERIKFFNEQYVMEFGEDVDNP